MATVLVDGATGYVGTHLVSTLAHAGSAVRCLVRPGADPADLAVLRAAGGEVVAAELLEPGAALDRAFAGVGAAVHLIGSIAPRRGERLEALHGGQARAAIEACRRHGVGRLVMVTALGARAGAPSRYHATKWESEEALRQSGLAHVILRPSLIVGRIVGRRDSKLVRRYLDLIASRPMVVVVGDGTSRVQPIFVGDLAAAIARVLVSETWLGQTLELGGPEVVTMREFLDALMRGLGVRKPVLRLPIPLARAVALVCETVQAVPLLSRDQITIARGDNVCERNALPALGVMPTSLAAALATYR